MASSVSQCSSVHAGGVAWYKNVLYVADTNCVITYDVNELYRLANGSYAIPVTGFWKRESTAYGLSGVSIDTSGTTPQLLSVHYETGCKNTDVGIWNLDRVTGGTDYMYRTRTTTDSPSDTKFLMPYNTAQNIYIDPVSGMSWSLTERPKDSKDDSTQIFSW